MVATAQQQSLSMQGIPVPAGSVDPKTFQQLTRRNLVPQATRTFAGLGQSDIFEMLQVGIIESLLIRISVTVTVTLNSGSCVTLASWPYGLVKNCRFSANGQSNLIASSGLGLKLREQLAEPELNDRSITRGVGGASPGTQVNNGTFSMNSESWGLGSNVTAVAGGTYTADLFYKVPVAMDSVGLTGAVFAQSASTALTLTIDWANTGELFTLAGGATATVAANVEVEAVTYSIPMGPNGQIVIPDLSTFHQYVENSTTQVSNANNIIPLVGTGIGRKLCRVAFRTMTGTAPALSPLIPNATNYGQLGWMFGGNDEPEIFQDGQIMRYANERLFGTDVGAVWGYLVHDFVSTNALRDLVDEGSATSLRLAVAIPAGVSLGAQPSIQTIQETLFAGTVGA